MYIYISMNSLSWLCKLGGWSHCGGGEDRGQNDEQIKSEIEEAKCLHVQVEIIVPFTKKA